MKEIELRINDKCYVMLNVCNNRYNVFIVHNNKVVNGLSTKDVTLVKAYIEHKKKYYKNVK